MVRGKNFNFDRPAIARCLNHAPPSPQIDQPVPRHAPIQPQITRVGQPVGYMKIPDQRPGLHQPVCDILLRPQGIGINSQTDLMRFIQPAQHIKRLTQTGHAGSQTAYHRVQRFKGDPGVIGPCKGVSFGQSVNQFGARIINRLPVTPGRRIRPKSARDHHHCTRIKTVRTVQHGTQMVTAGTQLGSAQGISDKSAILPDRQRLGFTGCLHHRVPDGGAFDLRVCQNADRAGKITRPRQAHLMNAQIIQADHTRRHHQVARPPVTSNT